MSEPYVPDTRDLLRRYVIPYGMRAERAANGCYNAGMGAAYLRRLAANCQARADRYRERGRKPINIEQQEERRDRLLAEAAALDALGTYRFHVVSPKRGRRGGCLACLYAWPDYPIDPANIVGEREGDEWARVYRRGW